VMSFGSMPSCATAVSAVSQQMSPEDSGRGIMAAWRQATAKPYGYLWCDLTCPEELRFRDSSLDTIFKMPERK
jgi:hypothetical protein